MPSISTSPESTAITPSQISVVVVLPGGIRPQQAKALAGGTSRSRQSTVSKILVGLAEITDNERGLGRRHHHTLSMTHWAWADSPVGEWLGS